MRPASPARGFTLIELLVVVAILSAASLLAFAGLGEDRAQLRYDDTRQRLQHLRAAVLGDTALAGYVVDNGRLPGSIADLLGPGELRERTALSPLFVPAPDSNSCTGSSGIALTDNGALLIKGHRGDYLGDRAFNGRFRDGWGNVGSTDDAANSGWATVLDAPTLHLSSLGADNAAGGSDYAADQTLAITANDWLLPIAGWTVTVNNARIGSDTANDIPAGRLSVSLLVFVNDSDGGQWRRYASAALPCLDGNGDGEVDGLACARSASVAFGDGCQPGVADAGLGRIPQGRHLLVLTDNGSDGQPWTADDLVSGGATLRASTPIYKQIDAIAGHNLPAVTLEIR